MGLLSLFGKSASVALMRLPSGTFTLDRSGRILASTLPQNFPSALVEHIGEVVLSTFRSAQSANIPLSEMVAEFSALKMTARELRGGAIVFLTPRGFAAKT